MNLYLLRVGADITEAGGCLHSPIFNGRPYLFMPVRAQSDIIPNKALNYGSYQWNVKSVEEGQLTTI